MIEHTPITGIRRIWANGALVHDAPLPVHALTASARQWLDVPWVHQGRSRAGVDCAGLLVMLARKHHLTGFDVEGYARQPDGTLEAAIASAGCTPGLLRVGALVCMRFNRLPQHVALITPYVHGGLAVLHALSTRGKVVEHRLDERWQRHICSTWALPGVNYEAAA